MNGSKTAVVTGVSSGIGRAIAKQLIGKGWHVFGSVRNQTDADAAVEALGDEFTPLLFDVTNADAISKAADLVATKLDGKTLDGLVNNAGISATGPMRYVPIAEIERIMDINAYGLLRTSRAFLPSLGADSARAGAPGKIINMSSISGKLSVPLMGPYSISKFAVEAISDAMRVEFLPHGIDVIVIEPGPVKTPIFAKTESQDFSQYDGTEYADALGRLVESTKSLDERGLEPTVIGELVLNIFETASPKTRYPITKNKFSTWTLPNLLPTRMLDKALARRMGLKPRG